MYAIRSYYGCAHAHEHFHKIGAADAEKRNSGLPGNGAGQQGFSGSRRPHEEDAFGNPASETVITSYSIHYTKLYELAKNSNYWEAMIINGLATSTILNSDPKIITDLLEKGALGASVSGNGPAIAAIVKKGNESGVKKVFSSLEGNIIVSKVNNKKADVITSYSIHYTKLYD